MKEEGEILPDSCIANSYEHRFGTDACVDANQSNEVQKDVRGKMTQDLHQNTIIFERETFERLLNPTDEDGIIEAGAVENQWVSLHV